MLNVIILCVVMLADVTPNDVAPERETKINPSVPQGDIKRYTFKLTHIGHINVTS